MSGLDMMVVQYSELQSGKKAVTHKPLASHMARVQTTSLLHNGLSPVLPFYCFIRQETLHRLSTTDDKM